MFPLNWNIPFIRKNGSRTTLGAITGDIAGIEEEVAENSMQIQTLTNQVRDMNNVYGSKNLLPFNLAGIIANNTLGTWSGNNYTVSGVTYTVNNDGSITANGTATTNTFIELISATDLSGLSNKYGVMVMNGCPSGGGTSSYIITTYNGTSFFTDDGDGVELPQGTYINGLRASIRNGYTAENVKFYPMLRLASITDDTYEPYAKTNQQLTQDTTALSVIPGATGSVFDISCNTPYERALVITPYSIGSLAYWSDTYHYIPLVTNPAITVTASNESSTGLTLTFTDSVVSVAIMSLTNRNDIWSGTKVS